MGYAHRVKLRSQAEAWMVAAGGALFVLVGLLVPGSPLRVIGAVIAVYGLLNAWTLSGRRLW